MKKLVYILSIGGLFIAFSSCQQGNVEELKKADDEKVNARVQSMIDDLNATLDASCTAKIDSSAQVAFSNLPKTVAPKGGKKPTGGGKPSGGGKPTNTGTPTNTGKGSDQNMSTGTNSGKGSDQNLNKGTNTGKGK